MRKMRDRMGFDWPVQVFISDYSRWEVVAVDNECVWMSLFLSFGVERS